jgi:hypothetical protein
MGIGPGLLKALMLHMLYEDVQIGCGEQALADLLGSSKWQVGYGSHQAVLLNNHLPSGHRDSQALPAVRGAVKPWPLPTSRFRFCTECLPLTSLKCLEWQCYAPSMSSSGINSLCNVLHCTPNLQYLWLRGGPSSCNLPALTTPSLGDEHAIHPTNT